MWEVAFRVALMYFLALIMIRILGKRALGELGPFDFVIMTGVGDTVISVALNKDVPYSEGFIILVVLAILELIMGYVGLKNGRISDLINGKPVTLIDNGQILKNKLAQEKFNIDDLMQELRKQGVRDIQDVDKGILESCGNFSVILKEEKEAVTREDLGITVAPNPNLQTTEELSRTDIFERMNYKEEVSQEPNLTDRIKSIETQLTQITALLEKRSQSPDP